MIWRLVGAAMVVSGVATASPSLRLESTGACELQPAVSQTATILGEDPFGDDARRLVRVVTSRDDDRVTAEITVIDPDGARGPRIITAADCRDLATSLAIIFASIAREPTPGELADVFERLFRFTTEPAATVLVPNLMPNGQRVGIWLAPAGTRHVALHWNGERVAEIDLPPGWSRVTFDLPAIELHTNELTIEAAPGPLVLLPGWPHVAVPVGVAVGNLELDFLGK